MRWAFLPSNPKKPQRVFLEPAPPRLWLTKSHAPPPHQADTAGVQQCSVDLLPSIGRTWLNPGSAPGGGVGPEARWQHAPRKRTMFGCRLSRRCRSTSCLRTHGNHSWGCLRLKSSMRPARKAGVQAQPALQVHLRPARTQVPLTDFHLMAEQLHAPRRGTGCWGASANGTAGPPAPARPHELPGVRGLGSRVCMRCQASWAPKHQLCLGHTIAGGFADVARHVHACACAAEPHRAYTCSCTQTAGLQEGTGV